MKVVASFYFKDGTIPKRIETATLTHLSSLFKPVEAVFNGSTECFLDVNIAALLDFITPIATLPETV